MKKDSFHAKLAFILSLGFWIPLFNIALCSVSLIIGIKALRTYFKSPRTSGGLYYAIAAIVFSITSIVLTVIGLIIYLYSDRFCGSAACQVYFANMANSTNITRLV